MPFKWKCNYCGKIFYESDEVKTLDEILSKFDGECPICGRKLARFPKDVKITPAKTRNTLV